MFSTIVAWTAFVLITVIFIALIIDGVRPRSEVEKALEKLESYQRGYTVKTNWRKVGILFAIWFAAGFYLWG